MDDAFMFYAIATGAIPLDGLTVEHVIEDIQTLNRRSTSGELDLTAISAATYPHIASNYWIAAVGSSVGQGYGPVLISRQPRRLEELSGKAIAVPGLQTTASTLRRLAVPDGVPVEMRFEEIPKAVVEGRVEAGLLIHEWQLTYRDAGLIPLLDLGIWWQQTIHLPLPLGLNVVKRSLGRALASRVITLLHQSILYAFSHQEEAIAYAMRYGRGIDASRAQQFVKMYVNEESLTLTKRCREALKILYTRMHGIGLIEKPPRLRVVNPLTF